jgi:SAM-dependent methyltransferase
LLLILPVAIALLIFAGLNLPIVALLLMQGIAAAAVSRALRLAPWWLPIQLVLPAAVLAAWSLQLPPMLYLAAFLFCLALFWTTFRTQVPYYPSGPSVWDAVAELLPQSRPIRVVDIGSGFGGFVLQLAAQRSDSDIVGVEVAPLPWAVSRLRAAFSRSKAVFMRTDYNRLDFSRFDVVFAYLSPAAMPALWEKARAEMRPGSLLLSYEFVIPGVESQIANICGGEGSILYGWNI